MNLMATYEAWLRARTVMRRARLRTLAGELDRAAAAAGWVAHRVAPGGRVLIALSEFLQLSVEEDAEGSRLAALERGRAAFADALALHPAPASMQAEMIAHEGALPSLYAVLGERERDTRSLRLAGAPAPHVSGIRGEPLPPDPAADARHEAELVAVVANRAARRAALDALVAYGTVTGNAAYGRVALGDIARDFPTDGVAHLEYGLALLQAGEAQASLAALTRACDLMRDTSLRGDALAAVALWHRDHGDPQGMLSAASEAAALPAPGTAHFPTPHRHLFHGVALVRTGALAAGWEALTLGLEAAATDPSLAALRIDLLAERARLSRLKGAPDIAVMDLEAALKTDLALKPALEASLRLLLAECLAAVRPPNRGGDGVEGSELDQRRRSFLLMERVPLGRRDDCAALGTFARLLLAGGGDAEARHVLARLIQVAEHHGHVGAAAEARAELLSLSIEEDVHPAALESQISEALAGARRAGDVALTIRLLEALASTAESQGRADQARALRAELEALRSL